MTFSFKLKDKTFPRKSVNVFTKRENTKYEPWRLPVYIILNFLCLFLQCLLGYIMALDGVFLKSYLVSWVVCWYTFSKRNNINNPIDLSSYSCENKLFRILLNTKNVEMSKWGEHFSFISSILTILKKTWKRSGILCKLLRSSVLLLIKICWFIHQKIINQYK